MKANHTRGSGKHIPRKRFGQNFLKSDAYIQKIIAAVHPTLQDNILEIGPGQGALTASLLEAAGRLDCVEIDRDLAKHLENQFGQNPKFHIHITDALKFDLNSLQAEHISLGAKNAEPKSLGPESLGPKSMEPESLESKSTEPKRLRVVGNLPYNITTPILFHLLKSCDLIQDMHFMLQKEVVDRLTASPNSKAFGKLTLMVQYFCKTEPLFTVPPTAFYPVPKIDSAVLRLTPFASPPYPVQNFKLFETLVSTAFNQRRKMLSNSLKAFLTTDDFANLGLNPERRPEQLSLQEWTALCNFLNNKTNCRTN